MPVLLRGAVSRMRIGCRRFGGLLSMSDLDNLRISLQAQSAGNISGERARSVESLLAACWIDLDVADPGGMSPDKLLGRTERMSWRPPVLSFDIERHGGTVLGSVRAEVQHWDVDVPKGEATWSPSGFRQKRPSASPLDVARLAAEVAASVAAGLVDPRLVWSGQTRVTVLVGEIIPMTVKQTTAGRRRRFATQLE